ncbi:glycosyltransferase family 4 protein [Pseudarthrobacter sp. L19]|uniref:glycosyltransferase family 4 protein n=1 Tax=Pseudarthrobacter sp. L19 TaxID=3423951 RepID=UPI003D7B4239
MPGAGGGSVRTHEINRRLAARGHEVTVLTTRYPGWIVRIQDGVLYVPIGFGKGASRLTRLLGYVICLPVETWKRRRMADLVVEDFFAPFSTVASPLWTRMPTIGVVQWLHAVEKSKQYKLPFHLIQRVGVRQHQRLIAVSQDTADNLLEMNPGARVRVIGNGVDRQAFEIPPRPGKDIVCIGRLEFIGKGIDLLLAAWAEAAPFVDGDLVIAGSGPDAEKCRRLVKESSVSHRVHFIGWIAGSAKFELLNSARLVVVPSRMETFGLVVLEALACSTPVVAFAIPSFNEVLPHGCGWLVRPFEIKALAREIIQRYGAIEELAAAGAEGRKFAATFDWDRLAVLQEGEYLATVAETPGALAEVVCMPRQERQL